MSKQIEKIQKKKGFDDGSDFEPRRKTMRGRMEPSVHEYENVLNNITSSRTVTTKKRKVYFVKKVINRSVLEGEFYYEGETEIFYDSEYYNKDKNNEYILLYSFDFQQNKSVTIHNFKNFIKGMFYLDIKSARWLDPEEAPEIIFFDECDTKLRVSTLENELDVVEYHNTLFERNFFKVRPGNFVVELSLTQIGDEKEKYLTELLEEAKSLGIDFEIKTTTKKAIRTLEFLISRVKGGKE